MTVGADLLGMSGCRFDGSFFFVYGSLRIGFGQRVR